MKYRADIDGLRAVAVLPVLFFHAGWTVFTGGYVGVDVFFVISGYLITRILAEEIANNRFSIVNFYERRIRRILPCLFTVILAASAVGGILLVPLDFKDFSKSVVAAVLFASNILFYRQSGYFDDQSAIKPMLHTWSLAVEEQFYIFFPILLWLIHRYAKDRMLLVLAPIAVLSFAISVWATSHAPSFAFYMAPSRIWELFIGAFLALTGAPRLVSRPAREVFAWGGLGLIAFAVFAYSEATPFPGFAALAPVGGAALLIRYAEGSYAGWLLSRRAVVFVGLVSYSLYLWHWPVIVYSEYYLVHKLAGWETVGAILVSFAIAALSWRYIERPFRVKGLVSRRRIFRGGALAASVVIAMSMAGVATDGWPIRFSDEVVRIESFVNAYSPRRSECHRDEDKIIPFDKSCIYGNGGPPTYAAWGDSHAVELIYALGEIAQRHNKSLAQFSYSGCPPALGLDIPIRPTCRQYNERVAKFLADSKNIDTVILISRYDNHEDTPGFPEGIRRSINALVTAGKRVVLVYPIPIAPVSVPRTLARYAATNTDLGRFAIDESEYMRSNVRAFRLLDTIDVPNIVRVFPHKRLCHDNSCMVYANGTPLYFDTQHLSTSGAEYLLPLFEDVFSEKGARGP